MASIAFDSPEARPPARSPISAHPAFPGIVALWFAALLGLGSMVLPVVLLDRLVTATGLASLFPMAAPPLGFTARALIALAAALIGAALGVSIARRVAQAHAGQPETRIAKLSAGSRRPISVHDELGGEGLVNGRGLPINRRRALAITEDDRPSDFLYFAPLPGEDPYAADAAAVAERPLDDPDEPLELCDVIEEDAPELKTAEASAADEWADSQPHAFEADETEERQEFRRSDDQERRKNAGGPRGHEPLPFSPPSLARRAPPPARPIEAEPEPVVQSPVEQSAPMAQGSEPQIDWTSAPLEALGLVQLVQRLGSTIERRRQWVAEAAASTPAGAVPAVPAEFEAAPAEEAAQAMAAYFGTPADPTPAPAAVDEPADEPFASSPKYQTGEEAAPSILRHLAAVPSDEDDEDEDEAIPAFSLPLRQPTPPSVAATVSFAAPAAPAADDAEEDDFLAEVGYSSLLGMTNPFAAPKPEFVRIEEPERSDDAPEPAVVFPGQESLRPASAAVNGSHRLFDPPGAAPPAAGVSAPRQEPPADADAALRAALATLQRMSGAA